MKNKMKVLLLTCIALLACMLIFSSCDREDLPQQPSTPSSPESETHIHAFGEWTTVKEATCTANGEQQRSCSCGEKERKSIDATGHTEVVDAAVSASCTEEGKTEGRHCSACKKVLVAQNILPSIEHQEMEVEGELPTATTSGYGHGTICKICKTTLKEVATLVSIRDYVMSFPTMMDDDGAYIFLINANNLIPSSSGIFQIRYLNSKVYISLTDYGASTSVTNITSITFNSANTTLMTYSYGYYLQLGDTQYYDIMQGQFKVSDFYNLRELSYSNTSSTIGGSAEYQTERFDGYKSTASNMAKNIMDLLDAFLKEAEFGYGIEVFGFDPSSYKYDATYDLNGGELSNTNPSYFTCDNEFTLNNPTKTGYTFLGWTYEGQSTPIKNVTISNHKGDLHFNANWEAIAYTITLDPNQGTVSSNTVTVAYDSSFSLPTPTREGYDFLGWYNQNELVTDGTYTFETNLSLTAQWELTKYNISYNLDNATTSPENPTNYTQESEFTLLNPEKAGYTFLGWTYDGQNTPIINVTISKQRGDLCFTANWEAHTNTPYKVEYYLENADKTRFDLQTLETMQLSGTTDTTATANIKEFAHFAYSEDLSNISSNISGDGSLVLKVYYTRNTYTISTSSSHEKAGVITGGKEYPYGTSVTLTATTNAGYTWLGWYVGDTLVSNSTEYTFTADKNLNLKACWSANTDTFYTVEYYLQNIDNNEYSLKESEILTGTTDTIVSATIKSYAHFMYIEDISNASGNINGDGTSILKIYYTRSSYNVTTRAMNAKAGTVSASNVYRYGKIITVTATTNPGYTFLGWHDGNALVSENESYRFTVENNVTLTAKWSVNENTQYTVEYYLENKNKTGYDKVDTIVLQGTTDTTANADIIEYAHFSYTSNNSVISGNIDGRGTLVLKVYYIRDIYTINSAVGNEKAGTVTVGGNYAYENSASLVASSNPGYTFLGWYEGDTKVCDALTFTFAAEKNVTYTAKWSADDATYTVNYYKKTFTKTGYVVELYDSVILNSKTGELVEAIDRGLDAYTFDSSASTMNGEVLWDNSLVLNIWYVQTYLREGNYIYFGEYPQSLKSDEVVISNTIDDRGYYLGDDGFYYAKVIADPFQNSCKFTTGETVTKGYTYYFKVEPIRWRILEESNGKIFIVCDSIITAQAFDEYLYGANRFSGSDIRKWLNDEFYKNSFSNMQQQLIQITSVDNSAESTGISNNPYAGGFTEDYIFLLSYSEVRNQNFFEDDSSRILQPTDYSRAIGVEYHSSGGYWWLRSPYDYSKYVRQVAYNGWTGIKDDTNLNYNENIGVVPAMWIKL